MSKKPVRLWVWFTGSRLALDTSCLCIYVCARSGWVVVSFCKFIYCPVLIFVSFVLVSLALLPLYLVILSIYLFYWFFLYLSLYHSTWDAADSMFFLAWILLSYPYINPSCLFYFLSIFQKSFLAFPRFCRMLSLDCQHKIVSAFRFCIIRKRAFYLLTAEQ